jgi:hypothetical protein
MLDSSVDICVFESQLNRNCVIACNFKYRILQLALLLVILLLLAVVLVVQVGLVIVTVVIFILVLEEIIIYVQICPQFVRHNPKDSHQCHFKC